MNELRGTGVALITPFDKALSVDFAALHAHVEFVLDGKVEYLVVMGTTGESPTLSWQEKTSILDHVLDVCQSRVPVWFGLGGNNTAELIHQLESIQTKKIAGILSVSPYYNRPSQAGLEAHYTALANASAFPLMLYNVPPRTAVNLEAKTTLALASHPRIIGIKEASGNMEQIQAIANGKKEEFVLLSGDDALTLDIMEVGGVGIISVLANYLPRQFSEMVRMYHAGHKEEARKLNDKLKVFYQLMTEEGNPVSVKTAVSTLGYCQNEVRLPLIKGSQALAERIQHAYAAFVAG
ncbi:MAG: 4-hydroxy-tetrahydrodipicolinate synthase [Cyclobacteriaceae bacterium]|nr:4-hydroxy-tetrahydrodipicolinate synthase [Cyclobacteriaceae bacterium]